MHFSNVGVGDAVGSGPCLLTGTKKPCSTELSVKMLTMHPIFKAPRGGGNQIMTLNNQPGNQSVINLIVRTCQSINQRK